MSISATCSCGQSLQTDAANAGRILQCPHCGRDWAVPKGAGRAGAEFLVEDFATSSKTSSKAVASLVLGILFIGFCFTSLPAILLGQLALRDIDRSKGRLRGKGVAIAGIVLGIVGCLFTVAMLFPAYDGARSAARRAQCTNNLKQIGLAMHNYLATHDCFPPAAITDKNGNPLLSWRVAILPFMSSNPRYLEIHLDEPWNSPHNLAFLDQMPSFYKCPSDESLKPGMTGYQVVVGQDTAFTPDFKGLKLSEFTDGLSNTLFVGESDHSVPWTKPEDVPAEIALHVKGLTGTHGNHKMGLNALFGDGSVKFLKSSIDPQRLYWMLTRDGGEVLSPHSF